MELLPKVVWDETKLLDNARRLDVLCQQHDIRWIPVTKAVCANMDIIDTLYKHGYRSLADSRIQNLQTIKKAHPDVRTYLLRLPGLSEIERVIKWADYSLVSEWETIERLDHEAKRQGKSHGIVVMVELGDLREGILPDELLDLGRKILRLSSIEWVGIGTNLTCYGGVIPTTDILTELVLLQQRVKEKLGHTLQIVSGGNSSTLPLVLNGDIPDGVNQLRLGESLFLGRETAYGNLMAGMHDDVFVLEAEIIEVKEKSSYPRGAIGQNAFGETPRFVDKGIRKRAIAGIGEQDVSSKDLVPVEEGISIIGASSDHLLLDVTDYEGDVPVGKTVSFKLGYRALLQAMTSKYVATCKK